MAQGDNDRAIADLTQAIRLKPDYFEAYVDRAAAFVDKHDYAAAMADANAAVQLRPDDPRALRSRGAVWSGEGEFEKAAADYTAAIELYASGDPTSASEPTRSLTADYADALGIRSGIYLRLGNLSAAKADADHAVQLDPTAAYSWNGSCWARALGNVELDAALADCERALTLAKSKEEQAIALDSRAMVQYRRGRFDAAIADDDAALANDSKHAANFRFLRGLSEEAGGRVDAGRVDVAAALAADPHVADEYARWGLRPK